MFHFNLSLKSVIHLIQRGVIALSVPHAHIDGTENILCSSVWSLQLITLAELNSCHVVMFLAEYFVLDFFIHVDSSLYMSSFSLCCQFGQVSTHLTLVNRDYILK